MSVSSTSYTSKTNSSWFGFGALWGSSESNNEDCQSANVQDRTDNSQDHSAGSHDAQLVNEFIINGETLHEAKTLWQQKIADLELKIAVKNDRISQLSKDLLVCQKQLKGKEETITSLSKRVAEFVSQKNLRNFEHEQKISDKDEKIKQLCNHHFASQQQFKQLNDNINSLTKRDACSSTEIKHNSANEEKKKIDPEEVEYIKNKIYVNYPIQSPILFLLSTVQITIQMISPFFPKP